MSTDTGVDTTFDFRTDTLGDADRDAKSPTLRRYHRLLRSKPLPTGPEFVLSEAQRGSCLHYRSELGEFWMTNDAIVHTYRSWTRFGLAEIVG